MAYFLATNVLSTTPPSVTPYIFGDRKQYIKTPIIDFEVNKVETDLYITKASLGDSAIMGSYWAGESWLLAQDDGRLAWMTNPRTIFASDPIVVGGHKLVMDLENGSTYDGVSVSSPGATVSTVNQNIYLFAADSAGTNMADIGIGRTKFYNHGTMLMDLVPVNAYNEDRGAKEGGFYDVVNDKYYFSDTSTPLVYSEL
jgi:hypothetical protein